MMGPEDVLEVLDCLTSAGVAAWVDGGWGVDALLEEQTRPHDDLDLVIALDDADETVAAHASRGFQVDEDQRPTRFVLTDAADRRVDFHTVTFDAEGGRRRCPTEGSTATLRGGCPAAASSPNAPYSA